MLNLSSVMTNLLLENGKFVMTLLILSYSATIFRLMHGLNVGISSYPAGFPVMCCGLSFLVVMVALCNRADHYIFIPWFLSIFYLSFFPP